MGSLSGILQRPLVAAATAMAVTSVSVDIPDKLSVRKTSDSFSTTESFVSSEAKEVESSWVSHIPVSGLANLNFVTGIRVPLPRVNFRVPISGHGSVPDTICSSVVSSPLLRSLYQSAELGKASKPATVVQSKLSSAPDALYRWHLPEPKSVNVSGNSDYSLAKSRTVVVLLGWLGARQKHLRRYADLYTSMGFHAITFTFPLSEILSYKAGGKAEQDIEMLVNHLADWLEEEDEKNLVFHTFSNTGWLTYGTILENFKKQDPSLVSRIRGCIVDSAPVAAPDPQVFASGFSAAFLKKHSVATKGYSASGKLDMNMLIGTETVGEPKPAVTEAALLVVLEKFFEVVLNLPTVNRRLSDVLGILSSSQPECPQLYLYSSADRVIPAGCVESFIEEQRKAGHLVRAYNFLSTPHVDHFRREPELYTSQLMQFLENHVLACDKHSS